MPVAGAARAGDHSIPRPHSAANVAVTPRSRQSAPAITGLRPCRCTRAARRDRIGPYPGRSGSQSCPQSRLDRRDHEDGLCEAVEPRPLIVTGPIDGAEVDRPGPRHPQPTSSRLPATPRQIVTDRRPPETSRSMRDPDRSRPRHAGGGFGGTTRRLGAGNRASDCCSVTEIAAAVIRYPSAARQSAGLRTATPHLGRGNDSQLPSVQCPTR
jgi:hypothetical protein